LFVLISDQNLQFKNFVQDPTRRIPNNLGDEWASDCCLTPTQQFFSYIMTRTS